MFTESEKSLLVKFLCLRDLDGNHVSVGRKYVYHAVEFLYTFGVAERNRVWGKMERELKQLGALLSASDIQGLGKLLRVKSEQHNQKQLKAGIKDVEEAVRQCA